MATTCTVPVVRAGKQHVYQLPFDTEEWLHWRPLHFDKLYNTQTKRTVVFLTKEMRDGWLRNLYGARKAAAILARKGGR